MRLLALAPFALALVLGGVALAQPGPLLDASHPPLEDDSWFTPEPKALDRAPDLLIRAPWASAEVTNDWGAPHESRVLEREGGRARGGRSARGPSTWRPPPTEVSIVDPWAPPVIASETPSLQDGASRTTDRSRGVRFSERFVEVRDPWQRMPEPAAIGEVRLTFDPWAR